MRANLILGVSGSILTLTLLFELLRRKHLREKYAIFWVGVAVMTLFVAAVPEALFWVADLVGVSVPANLLFFVASMTLLAISIQHSHELGRLEERTRVLAEEIALLAMQMSSSHEARAERRLSQSEHSGGTTKHEMHDVAPQPGIEDRSR